MRTRFRDYQNLPMFDIPKQTWVETLDPLDYTRLYGITLKAYRDQHPGKPDPSELVIIGMMNEVGPKVALNLLRRAVDEGHID